MCVEMTHVTVIVTGVGQTRNNSLVTLSTLLNFMFSIPLRLDKLDIYIYTTVNATICTLLIATVLRCKLYI